MNKEYWQTKEQMKQLGDGKTVTQRVNAYVSMWEKRCYSDGIPDGEGIPVGLMQGYRVPSYKKIAIAILKNDLKLKSLGFSGEDSELSLMLKREKTENDSNQIKLAL